MMTESSPLPAFRQQAYMMLGLVTAPFIFPFGLYSLIEGRPIIGIAALLVSLIAAANALAIRYRGHLLIAFGWVYAIVLALLVWGIRSVGEPLALWTYPLPIVISFIAERRHGRQMTALDLQQFYHAACCRFLERRPEAGDEPREIVAIWGETMDALRELQATGNLPACLSGVSDWIRTKKLFGEAGVIDVFSFVGCANFLLAADVQAEGFQEIEQIVHFVLIVGDPYFQQYAGQVIFYI